MMGGLLLVRIKVGDDSYERLRENLADHEHFKRGHDCRQALPPASELKKPMLLFEGYLTNRKRR
jgi:hypothetical protein